ncbi:glucose 1-dehydrogenase [bacterium]|jgi:3alpha(or 20beta)-hydroxysteroid dehydrogenase|nr:glucose 1-dehydrogenase [bacterium]MDB2392159.1 glucose 1-dehydrogenase [Acidimicrobiaceae bacterium]
MNRLDDKVALITGGARGQGAAEAELFVNAGAHVVITDVLDAEGDATAERLGAACEFLHHDVASEDQWASVVDTIIERHGRLDVLVNNAGIFRTVGLIETSLEMWQQMMDINQTGVFLGMRTAAPAMQANGSGSIINISSIAGMKSAAVAHAYSASKWAVRGMTKSAAVELAPSGVRVNSVHPGIIDTDMLQEFGQGVRDSIETRIPMGRVASAEEVGKLVLFLASDDSSYCSGHEFVIDGAMIA